MRPRCARQIRTTARLWNRAACTAQVCRRPCPTALAQVRAACTDLPHRCPLSRQAGAAATAARTPLAQTDPSPTPTAPAHAHRRPSLMGHHLALIPPRRIIARAHRLLTAPQAGAGRGVFRQPLAAHPVPRRRRNPRRARHQVSSLQLAHLRLAHLLPAHL